MQPSLSVVMPCRNYGQWLPFSMASVLASELHDLELLVVDDGSGPDVAAVVRAFTKRDARVRYLRIEWDGNDNDEAPFLTGLAAARGEFTCGVGADDLVQPWLYAAQVAVLRARQVALVYCDMLHMPGIVRDGWLIQTGDSTVSELPDWNPQLLTRRNYIPDVAMLRTELYRSIKPSYGVGLLHWHQAWLRFATAGLRGVRIAAPGYIYVKHDDSLWTRKRLPQLREDMRNAEMRNLSRDGSPVSETRIAAAV